MIHSFICSKNTNYFYCSLLFPICILNILNKWRLHYGQINKRCISVCVCVYGLTIWCYWVRRQGWPGSSLRTPLHPQVEWQATLMTLDGTQTLVVSRLSKLDSRGASEGDLVLLGSNSGRWGPVKDQVGGGIAWEKGGDWIVSEHLGRHLSCCLSVLRLEKPFDVCIQQQPVRVLVERHESSR